MEHTPCSGERVTKAFGHSIYNSTLIYKKVNCAYKTTSTHPKIMIREAIVFGNILSS